MNAGEAGSVLGGNVLAGVDIGGTRSGVCLGRIEHHGIELLDRREIATRGPAATLAALLRKLQELRGTGSQPVAVGVSCGGPLDAARGLVLGPPNLPGWDGIDVVTPFASALQVPGALCNDADAGALAEWYWGAGRGCRHLAFITHGTGLGAGLVLNGALYTGRGLAGEVGHVRMQPAGPRGHGKAGSLEGFASGGGIARRARELTALALAAGGASSLAADQAALEKITAREVAAAARAGDALAGRVMREAGYELGRGLAVLVDVLHLELIVLGSLYVRCRDLLEQPVWEGLRQEALEASLRGLRLEPTAFGEAWGWYAALAAATRAPGAETIH